MFFSLKIVKFIRKMHQKSFKTYFTNHEKSYKFYPIILNLYVILSIEVYKVNCTFLYKIDENQYLSKL